MSIFNILKKTEKPILPGEVRGEYIGCYFFGIAGHRQDDDSYHSLATTRGELISDCKSFLARLLEIKKEKLDNPKKIPSLPDHLANLMPAEIRERHHRDLAVISDILQNIDRYIDMHLASDTTKPFWTVSGMELFLRIGGRKRQMINGKYLE